MTSNFVLELIYDIIYILPIGIKNINIKYI